MMGQLDTDPIPPHAITCWATDHDIVVLLPMKAGGKPYMMKFRLSEGGLAAALAVLIKRKDEVLSPRDAQPLMDAHRSNILGEPPRQQPQVRISKVQERLYAETTPEQRDAAQSLLKKLGFVK
jgi:hypothetical protein